jgi:hypothetical protein
MKYFAIYAFKTLINKQINQRWINLINEVSANHRNLMKSGLFGHNKQWLFGCHEIFVIYKLDTTIILHVFKNISHKKYKNIIWQF